MLLKTLHFLAFSVAIGGGSSALILMLRAGRMPEAAPHLRAAVKVIATGGIWAIGLLWLTGIGLWVMRHGASMALGGGWHLKLTAVVVLTALAGYAFARMAAGKPLPPLWARRVLIAQLATAVVTVATAIATFG